MIANISPSSLTYEDTYNTLKYADRAKQIKTKVVRNVLNVEFHVSRYRVIVHELQQEIAELKCKLADGIKPPPPVVKQPPETSDESKRLQDLVRRVYGERLRLRKHMVDLDTQERETLLRICRKERDLHRIDTLTGNDAKKAKLAAKVSELQRQIVDVERQKQMIHEYLFSNNEAVSRVQREVTRSASDSAGMQELMREVVVGRKLEAENAHHWRQTKHLLRYIKAQEREIGKTERILLLALEVARKQQSLLRAHSALTPSLREIFSNLVHAAEGEKGVAWADMNASLGARGSFRETQHETVSVAGLSVAQKALFDTFLVHASPARRLSLDKHSPAVVQKPVAGILTKTGSTASNGSGASTATTDGSETTSAGGDSGVGVGKLAAVERSNSDASSVVSSLLSSRLSSIPDKPRMPTPIDDLSSSCSSNNSIYDTRLNTVLNSYHQKPNSASSSVFRSTAAGSGRYTKLPNSRGGTPTPVGYDSPQPTPRGTPEPYLTPLPSLHKLTLTRQNSDLYKMSRNENGTTYTSQPPTPSFTANSRATNGHPGLTSSHSSSSITGVSTAASSRVLYGTSGGEEGYRASKLNWEKPASTTSAFSHVNQPGSLMARLQVPPRTSTSQAVPSSAAYMQFVANATRVQSAPVPPPRLHSTGKTTSKLLPPPVPTPPFPSMGRFEDNFVSASSHQIHPFSVFQKRHPPDYHQRDYNLRQ
ncbi:Kinesin-like protein KIF18A [Geodia barretti]|nr:Kinesin-like protein KIF18A [Geodia barretti]